MPRQRQTPPFRPLPRERGRRGRSHGSAGRSPDAAGRPPCRVIDPSRPVRPRLNSPGMVVLNMPVVRCDFDPPRPLIGLVGHAMAYHKALCINMLR